MMEAVGFLAAPALDIHASHGARLARPAMKAVEAVGWLAVPTTVMLFVSPAEACFKIYRAKDTGGFSVVPYYAALVNNTIWLMYALTKGINQVILVNSIGWCCSVLSIAVFLQFSPKKADIVLKVLVATGACAAAYVLSIALSAHVPQVKTLGAIGIITSGIMYGGPFAVAADVIKTKSVKFMPLTPLVFAFAATSLWTSYAILKGNMFVLLGNGPGLFLSTMQLALYFIYSKGSKNKLDERTPLTA